MAIEKKSLISNSKGPSTKSNVKAKPSPKLRTAIALQTASNSVRAITAIKLAKAPILKTAARF